MYRINAQDYDKQMADKDFWVAPGRFISDDCMKNLPPTAVLTSEFDSVGRGARQFAARLKSTAPDKFLGLLDIPGAPHGYETHHHQPETKMFTDDFKKAFDAWVAK